MKTRTIFQSLLAVVVAGAAIAQLAPGASGQTDRAVATSGPEAQVVVPYTCDNPLGDDPITTDITIDATDSVDPADVGESVAWTFTVDQPSLGTLPVMAIKLHFIELKFPRPAGLTNVAVTLSDPPGETANPAVGLADKTITADDVQLKVPNDGRKIIAWQDGRLEFPDVGGSPVVLPIIEISGEPTAAARGTLVDWLAPDLLIEIATFDIGPVNCAPTTPTSLVDTTVNAGFGVTVDAPAEVVAGDPIPVNVDVDNEQNVGVTGASLAVAGAPACDDAAIGAMAAHTVVESDCTVDTTGLLTEFDKDAIVQIQATATSTETGAVMSETKSVRVVPPPAPWPDVLPWYADAANWLGFWSLADGYPDGEFKGNNDITRGALARMVYRMAGSPDTSTFDQNPFTDMEAWAADAMRWVANDPDGAGPLSPLMTGDNGAFNAGDPITRAQVIRLLYRFAGEFDVSALPPAPFPDTPLWVQDAVRWAAADLDGAGPLEPMITGANGLLLPNDPITRAQTTRILYRLCIWLLTQAP